MKILLIDDELDDAHHANLTVYKYDKICKGSIDYRNLINI